MSKTSTFGTSKREGHDAKGYYARRMMSFSQPETHDKQQIVAADDDLSWTNQVYNQSSTDMCQVPDRSVALAFTSPPYNVGKNYDQDLDQDEYLGLIEAVGKEVYRTLIPGGRYVVNIANLGRKPYIPLHALFHVLHSKMGFMSIGEIIWQKAKGAGGNCAWGSWNSAKSPSLRDIHEYLLVFTKERFGRTDRGISTMEKEEFMSSTLSIWNIPPESAKRIGHPAPFPVELASRVVNLYSYVGDVVLDPFLGSGTTAVAATKGGRRYVGYELNAEYCELARKRIEKA